MIKKILFLVLILILLSMLASCSASWHLRRAIQKDATLFDTTRYTQVDTLVRVVDEVDTGTNCFKRLYEVVSKALNDGEEVTIMYKSIYS